MGVHQNVHGKFALLVHRMLFTVACMRTGFEVLTAMEKVPTDDDDRPVKEVKITGATVFVNPYKEEEEAERKAAEEARLKVCSPYFWWHTCFSLNLLDNMTMASIWVRDEQLLYPCEACLAWTQSLQHHWLCQPLRLEMPDAGCGISAVLTGEGGAFQAEKEAGPPTEEEKVGMWFSNPAAEHSTQAQRTGVGKYLNAQAVRKAEGLSADAQVGVATGPPAKKAKQALYGNFDAW